LDHPISVVAQRWNLIPGCTGIPLDHNDCEEQFVTNFMRFEISMVTSPGNPGRCTPVHELQVAFKISYVYDYITKLCRTQAELILNHVNTNVHGTEQGAARHRKYKRLKLGGTQAYDHSAD
jgi:hypothetical protein